jgi:rhomboid protease GluP
MRGLMYRLLLLWYRLTGSTAAQADWRARRKLAPKADASDRKRTQDPRYICACGQLLVKGDRVCPQCGRKQLMPFWMRRIGRSLGIRDESTTPVATFAMLATMLVGYFAQMRLGSGGLFSPSTGAEMVMLGASVPALTLDSQIWRAVTYTMVHGGLMHIAFNSIALVQVGPLVEMRFGKARFLAAWVFGAVGGALLADMISPSQMRPLVGASGAIFALIGMAGVQGHREGTAAGRQIRNTMIFWAVMTTVLGAGMGGISHAGHFGGLILGVIIAVLLPPADQASARRRITPVIGISAVLALVLSIGGLVQWFAAGNPPPASAPLPVQFTLYHAAMEVRGGEAVFGEEALGLLNRARRSDGLGEAERMRLLSDVLAISADWPPAKRELLRAQVLKGMGLLNPQSEQPVRRRQRTLPDSPVDALRDPPGQER